MEEENSMRIGVLGLNHKLAGVKLREKVAQACQKHFSPELFNHENFSFVLLSTCNRTEIYFSSSNLTETHGHLLRVLRKEVCEDFEQKLYSFFKLDCFRHLAHVTAGIDSAIIGETEIQGQVKIAYENAAQYQRLGSELHYLFQKSLKIGKKARNAFPIQSGKNKLGTELWRLGNESSSLLSDPKILFIGASEINETVCKSFYNRGIKDLYIANRTLEAAKRFGEKYKLQILPWEDLKTWTEFDWVICGTKAGHALITADDIPVSRGIKTLLLVDLALPRNIDPELAKHVNGHLHNIDEIHKQISKAENLQQHKTLISSLFIAEESKKQIAIFLKKKNRLFAAI
jgi:glutamyl-tRNA reductase